MKQKIKYLEDALLYGQSYLVPCAMLIMMLCVFALNHCVHSFIEFLDKPKKIFNQAKQQEGSLRMGHCHVGETGEGRFYPYQKFLKTCKQQEFMNSVAEKEEERSIVTDLLFKY